MISLGYPAVILSHGDPAVLELQVQYLHVLLKFIDGVDVELGQLTALLLGLCSSWFGQTTRSPHPLHWRELYITSLAGSSTPSGSKSLGHFFSQPLWIGLSISSSTVSVLTQICRPGEVQGHLWEVVQLVWGRGSSPPSCPSCEPSGLLQMARGKQGKHLSFKYSTTWQMKGIMVSSPALMYS